LLEEKQDLTGPAAAARRFNIFFLFFSVVKGRTGKGEYLWDSYFAVVRQKFRKNTF
jgi:hypothetical protein